MHFTQQVKLTKTHPLDVIKSFHDKGFIKYLTAAQPVRIDSWNGIDDDKEASFSFWFFGWRKIKVVHKNYSISDSRLYFEDLGTSLPFGLSKWKHQHIVEPYRKGSIIIADTVNCLHRGSRNVRKRRILLIASFYTKTSFRYTPINWLLPKPFSDYILNLSSPLIKLDEEAKYLNKFALNR